MKTFDKKGDSGETDLLFGRRVSKSDLRCEAYGTIDEAISALGIARNLVAKDKVKDVIFKVQRELFKINAELATKPEDYEKLTLSFTPVTDKMVKVLEDIIVELEAETEMPKSFIIPGSKNIGAAWIDLSRTIMRRAERRVVDLKKQNDIKNKAILQYLNRLSDLLFVLARYEEK
jgi:cob(I)alamin adenosyltransferase